MNVQGRLRLPDAGPVRLGILKPPSGCQGPEVLVTPVEAEANVGPDSRGFTPKGYCMIDCLLGDLELPGKLGLRNAFFFQQLLDAISGVCYHSSSPLGYRTIDWSNFNCVVQSCQAKNCMIQI